MAVSYLSVLQMNQDLALFSLWAKTDRSITLADQQSDGDAVPDFHPLIYHLLDVAAYAEALLQEEQGRLERLAEACHANFEELRSCVVTLIALHDLGKCARGFQGKVLPL